MDSFDNYDHAGNPPTANKYFVLLGRKYQSFLDQWTPYVPHRWAFTTFVFLFFCFRVLYHQGWYIIAYALGIYYLNMLLAFLTPKIDPAMQDDDDGPALPTSANEEFRPFIRRLPEFKFWHSSTKAALIALFCSFFECFDIPVFWPILLLYFLTLFFVTMKRQIRHMMKYRYLPWTTGKARYQGKEDSGKIYSNLPTQPSLLVPLIPSTTPTTLVQPEQAYAYAHGQQHQQQQPGAPPASSAM